MLVTMNVAYCFSNKVDVRHVYFVVDRILCSSAYSYKQLMYDGDVTARVALLGEASGVQLLATIDYGVVFKEVERQRLELRPGT